MRLIFTLTVVLFVIGGCETSNPTSYVVLVKESLTETLFKNSRPSHLSNEDIIKLENIIKDCINKYNSELQGDEAIFSLMNLDEYKRQYLPVLNSDGDKIVWVNFFCDHGGLDWTNVIIGTDDGGNCFAHFTVNLTNGTCNDISINGFS